MSDSNETGTVEAGTQAVEDTATTTGSAVDAGTQGTEATQPEATTAPTDSQPSDKTPTAPDATKAIPGKQEPGKPDTANPFESDQNLYRKRFNDTLSHAQRLYQEKQERDRQFQELQGKLSDYETKAKAQAEAANLHRWNKGHPEHAKFRSLQERADFSRKMLANAQTPEDQAAARRLMAGQFTQEELTELEHSEQDRKALITEFSADPRGFISSHVQDAVRAAIGDYDQYIRAARKTEGILQDPDNSKLIEAYAPDMARMMDQGIPASEKAFEYARLKAENEALKAQVGQKVVQVATADARRDALNGRRQPRSNRPQNDGEQDGERSEALERLSKRGIKPGDSRFSSAYADELLRSSRT